MSRRPLLVVGLVGLLFILAWYFLLWSPRNADLEAARERKEAAETRNQDLQAAIARLRASQRDEPALRARLERLRGAIPDRPDLAQFILDTNDAAIRAGIDFISVSPSPPAAAAAAAGAGVGTTATTVATATTTPGATGTTATAPSSAPAEIRVALQINGGYFQVIDFLNRLADMPRIVVIDGLNVTSDPAGRLSSTLSGRMFVQPSALNTAPTATTPATGATTSTTAAAGGATTTTAAGGAATTTTTGARP